MKFAGLFCIALVVPAYPQSAPPEAQQHGVRANEGLQTTYLFDGGDQKQCTLARAPGPALRGLIANPGVYGSGEANPPSAAAPAIDHSIACIQFDAWVEHLYSDYAVSIVGGFAGIERQESRATFQRSVRDNLRQVYISYAVIVEALPENGAYRIGFSDATAPAPADLRPSGGWQIGSPPGYPAPQIVHEGDEIRLPLYANPSGVEVADYIHVGRLDKIATRQDAARDTYDSAAEFTLTEPRVTVNGVPRKTAALPKTMHGVTPWVYVPGYGRFVLSFGRRAGLEKTGEASGNVITLWSGGNILRITGTERVAAGGGVYNVYAILDRSWEPVEAADREQAAIGMLTGDAALR